MRTFSKSTWLSLFMAICLIAVSVVALKGPGAVVAQERERCTNALFSISQGLPNGSRWNMCWEERSSEGIVLRNIRYITPTGESRLILSQANLAQIHVPYDDNTARFHDLSDYGLGGSHLNNMTAADCPGGTLLQNNSRNVLCVLVAPQGYAYKFYETQKQASSLVVWSVSHIGQYNYINRWVFNDDGSISPSIGATGKLQKCTNDPRYGWPVSPSCARGTSHVHNYYWRLDFDIAGMTNNVVEQIEFDGVNTDTRAMKLSNYTMETAAQAMPANFRSWRVKNTAITNAEQHVISYELHSETSNVFRGPSYEPWTQNDVYVTQYNPCEMWASHNPTSGGCANNVSAFVNGQTITDPIVWYGVTFHHLARDEDDPMMSAHWSSFDITPRDMDAQQGR